MNKKKIEIIVILSVIIVIFGVCIFVSKHNSKQIKVQNEIEDETGAFNKMSIVINGYTININSKEVGHPSHESIFSTSFNIISNHKKNSYTVDFVDLITASDNTNNNGIVYDIAKPEVIKINGKKFDYYLDESNCSATLYYIIPDGKGSLSIKVSGGSVFDSKGNLLDTLAPVNKKVLKSKELAGILNFTVSQ